GPTSEAWFQGFFGIDSMGEKGFAKMLGLPESADAKAIAEHLGLVGERLQAQERAAATVAVIPTAADKLNVSRDLMSSDRVRGFHEKVEEISATLKASPEDAGTR